MLLRVAEENNNKDNKKINSMKRTKIKINKPIKNNLNKYKYKIKHKMMVIISKLNNIKLEKNQVIISNRARISK